MPPYMGESTAASSAERLEELAKEVLLHHETLVPVTIKAYQPRGLTPRFLTVTKPFISKETGYAFGGDHPSRSGFIVEAEHDAVAIATRYESARLNGYFAVHTLHDYVDVWLRMHEVPVDAILFQIERLLPVNHPARRESSEESCRHHIYT